MLRRGGKQEDIQEPETNQLGYRTRARLLNKQKQGEEVGGREGERGSRSREGGEEGREEKKGGAEKARKRTGEGEEGVGSLRSTMEEGDPASIKESTPDLREEEEIENSGVCSSLVEKALVPGGVTSSLQRDWNK